jgi:hypothetical protein
MTKEQFIKRILIIEIVGFITIIIVVWLDELIDLPYLIYGSDATPINYFESILETVVISLLAIIIIFLTHTIWQRLKYLEGILPVCSFCKKIRLKDSWIPIENYVSDHSEADFSHSICPECMTEHYSDIMEVK